jgi:Fur family transcriptional regulator, peroxide stress response regulator
MDITSILRDNGLKVTPQRLAVYNLLASTKDHPSAEAIYNKLYPLYPTMSLATVYKTLEVLVKSGLVQQLNVGENSFRYDANVSSHSHITCIKCHRVDDIEDNLFAGMDTKISHSTSYSIINHQLYFFGICPHCKQPEQ